MKPEASAIFFPGAEGVRTATYKDQAYALLRDAILYHRLESGVVYSQDELCQQLGISRTPVREALLELQNEGYVKFNRGKGIEVVRLDGKAIRDVMEFRLYLEQAAAELAAKNAADEELKAIEDCLIASRDELESKDSSLCYRLDHQFHRLVAKAAHNDRLYQSLDNILDHYLRFEKLSIYNSVIAAKDIWENHRDICEGLKARDPKRAGEAAVNHLQEAYRRTLGDYWN